MPQFRLRFMFQSLNKPSMKKNKNKKKLMILKKKKMKKSRMMMKKITLKMAKMMRMKKMTNNEQVLNEAKSQLKTLYLF